MSTEARHNIGNQKKIILPGYVLEDPDSVFGSDCRVNQFIYALLVTTTGRKSAVSC